MAGVLQMLVVTTFGAFLASSLWLYPHSLSYFNESIGGPLNGAEHLLGSNVDWGQDVSYVHAWFRGNVENTLVEALCQGHLFVSQNPNAKKVSAGHQLSRQRSAAILASVNYVFGQKSTPLVTAKRLLGANDLLRISRFRGGPMRVVGGYSHRLLTKSLSRDAG